MSEFTSVKIVGGLLPADLLGRIFAGDAQVPGTAAQTYGLERGESVRRQASRTWLYLLEVWQEFKQRIDERDASDGVSARVTRERWLRILLRELGFHHLTTASYEIEGKPFPVSHQVGAVPVHLLGWATDLDHKTPNVTARAPQSMLQELLNRDDSCLWAVLSNGRTLRLLRDSAALVGSAYVEFDLTAIFDGELFSDFVLLYLVCHESRFAGDPSSCYLEQWRSFAEQQGERALEQLRTGVQQAISVLGTGFLTHPDNPQLRARLDPASTERITLDDLNRALLRVVYRMLFWFVAEDRGALLQPDPEDAHAAALAALREARDRYAQYFSSARLRQLARRRRGSRHSDLYDAMELVFDALGAEGGVPELALPGIGGIFESKDDDGRALPLDEPLAGARLSNEALLEAVRALSLVRSRDGGALRRVDFGNLGAEELGSVYESLLELKPFYDDEQTYQLEVLPGNERKESGSYYTPSSLVECLLDSALDPLLDGACSAATPPERVVALLDLTVCDPACGSGHFLVAAAKRIAKRVAAEETGESEPPDPVVRAALRRVVGRCIYGVDVNPMAVELAKVSLWLEALEPGKPLSYLDENIRPGNSLLGVTPALLAAGIPDGAYKAIEGDDKKVATALKKQNAGERDTGQFDLFSQSGIPVTNATLAKRADEIAQALPDSLEDLHIHQQREAELLASSPERRIQKLLADAWCAAFVQPKTLATRGTAITHAVLEGFAANDDETLDRAAAEDLVSDLTRQYRFFHWHVEFPRIFRVGNGHTDIDPSTGWSGGFSCVIGNPPWDQVQLDPREFFASRAPAIADAANMAAREKLISRLAAEEPELYAEYSLEQRHNDALKHFVHESGLFSLTSYGRLNTYSLFAELSRTVISGTGRSGVIVPTGIATDSFNQYFFSDLVRTRNLVSVYDFENEEKLFKDVNNRPRFCLLVITGRVAHSDKIALAFRARQVRQLSSKRFILTADDISRLNPNTLTCPVFDEPRHAQIIKNIYRHVPILWREDPDENPWRVSFQLMFMMNTDSDKFKGSLQLQEHGWQLNGNVFIRESQHMLPLYEAKMIHHFDSRFATYEGATEAQLNKGTLPRLTSQQHDDPDFTVLPRYWVAETEVGERLARRGWDKGWVLGWRDVARSSDERTMICSVLPKAAVGHKLPLAMTPRQAHLLAANWSSFVLDYVVRQKMAGASMTFFIVKQLPILPPTVYQASVPWLVGATYADWIRRRVLELNYTSYDLGPFAADLGENGPPFRWDEERRFVMRCELDAAYFHLYGIEHDDVDHIMDSFRAFQNNDRPRFERTKKLILDIYDAMAEATRTGVPYQTILDPPPGQGPRHE